MHHTFLVLTVKIVKLGVCFNQSAIVLPYSAHIKPRKTIKTIKTENITHKHYMTIYKQAWNKY